MLKSSQKLDFLSPLLSGFLVTLSLPKWNLPLLIFFALIPLFQYLKRYQSSTKMIFLGGLIFGLSHFSSLLYWIVYTLHRFSSLPLIAAFFLLLLLSSYLSLYYICLFLVTQRLGLLSTPSSLRALIFSFLWVGAEYARSRLFSGLPWGLLGEALTNYQILLQVADLLGVYGLTFLVVFFNYTLSQLLNLLSQKQKGRQVLVQILPSLLLILGFYLYGLFSQISWEERIKEVKTRLRVSLLQGNIPQELKENKEAEISVKVYQRLLLNSIASSPDLVFTPETAFPFYFPNDRERSLELLSFLLKVKEKKLNFIFGAFRLSQEEKKRKVHNSLFLWEQENISDFYDKEKLVPFGEYIPLGRYLPFLRKISVVSDVLKPGEGKNLKVTVGETLVEVTPLICFESAFSELARERSLKGGKIIFVATNDAWFGQTSAPYQHFQMLKLRAVENRRFALQAANTGFSGAVSPTGEIIVRSSLESEEVVHTEIKPLSYPTLYQKYGYLFPQISTLLYGGTLFSISCRSLTPRIRIFFKTPKG